VALEEADDREDRSKPADGPGSIDKKRRRRRSRALRWGGSIGAIVVLFVAWQLWGTSLVEHHWQTQLAQQFAKGTGTSPANDRPFGLVRSTARVAVPPEGSVMARIQIPALGVDQYAVEGTSSGDLEKGPGHYAGTAVPGQAGNVAMAGRRTTFGSPFGRLDELHPGESITLTTRTGEVLIYSVSELPRTVAPSDVSVLTDFGDNRLTLITSAPMYSATRNLVVVAVLAPTSTQAQAGGTTTATPAPRAGPPPGPLAQTHTGSWNLRRLPLAVLLVALLVLLGLANRRPRHRRRLGSLLVLGPIWIAGVYLLFAALSSVLPSTL
jgi:sortase A